MKKKVLCAFFINPVTVPGAISSDNSLNAEKQDGLEMYTGIEPGWITLLCRGKEGGTPIANCRSLVWESDEKK